MIEQTEGTEQAGDAIVHEIVYPHPIQRVWRALTDPTALAAWLMPNDFAPRVGHRFTFHTAPEHDWNGTVECEVVQIAEPTLLSYTWRGGKLPATLVTFTFTAVAGGTRLRLVHSGFASGGPVALIIRDRLSSGWGSKVLRTRLPTLLEHMAAEHGAHTTSTL